MQTVKEFTDVCSVVISAIALLISIIAWHHSRGTSVKEFFEQGDSASMKRKRKILYDLQNENIDRCSSDAMKLASLKNHVEIVTSIVSFYDTWGLLLKKGYLPIWVFDGAAGDIAKNIYSIVLPYINYRKSENADRSCQDYTPHYGDHFKYMIDKLHKRQSCFLWKRCYSIQLSFYRHSPLCIFAIIVSSLCVFFLFFSKS